MKINWSEPGIPLSAAIHAGLLLATLVAFSSTTKFEEQPESIAVEMVSPSELTQMTKGDKTVKEVKPDAKIKADKIAEEELIKQESADAKKDVPTPPAKPPEPQPTPEPKADPKPIPPPPPAPTPPTPEAKPDPTPVDPKPEGLKQAPPPPPKPEPKPQPPKAEVDPLAKLIEQDKKAPPPKPVDAPKTPTTSFDPAALQKLLVSKETPQKMASIATETAKSSAAGTTTGTAAKLSLDQSSQINGYVKAKVQECWKLVNVFPDPNRPVPIIRIKLKEDGTFDGIPTVTNPSSDPLGRAYEESAIRAVTCGAPFDMLPKKFKAFYGSSDGWNVINFPFKLQDE